MNAAFETATLCQRDAITNNRLVDEPYDLAAALERVVVHRCRGREHQAKQLFERLSPLLAPSEGLALLHQLVSGSAHLSWVGGCYMDDLLDAPSCEELALGCLVGEIAHHLASTLHLSAATVILRLHTVAGHPYCVRLVNGFGLVCAGRDELLSSGARALLAHEITHATLSSGHVFFDEGLATYFERQVAPASGNPTGAPSLRALVHRDCARVINAARSEQQIQSIYERGATLIDWILREHGARALVEFMKALPVMMACGRVTEQFEQEFRVNIGRLEKELHP